MSNIDTEYEIKHVQAAESDEGDPQGRGFFHLNASVLARLLFCDIYAVDEMHVENGVLTLAVHHTGPAMPRTKRRNVCWDSQQQGRGDCGAVSLHVVALEKQ